MQETLSVAKVYKNAGKYVATHPFAFVFLTVFYFLGSLLPMFIGTAFFKVLLIPYYYIFFYFAAGCYYRKKILWNMSGFIRAGVLFLKALFVFLATLLVCSFCINLLLNFVRSSIVGSPIIINLMLGSLTWNVCKYIFIFVLFIVFFVIPSFTFVSEITGKSRSILTAYAKTKGNVIYIGIVALIAFISLLVSLVVCALLKSSPFIAELIRDMALVFVSIVYFKMYDFFYKIPQKKKSKQSETVVEQTIEPVVQKQTKQGNFFQQIKAIFNFNTSSLDTQAKGDTDAHKG